MNALKILKSGILDENPTFVQAIGMCPVLAVTTSAVNGLGMGVSTTAVLACSNLVIALIRHFVPDKVRIPCFIVVICSFVTIVEFILKAYFPALNSALGIFIPLIVVNCVILARAEAFASKNAALPSLLDGLAMGLGFTVALMIIGVIREFFGAGSVFGFNALPKAIPRTVIMVLPPGAFLTLGGLMALFNHLRGKH